MSPDHLPALGAPKHEVTPHIEAMQGLCSAILADVESHNAYVIRCTLCVESFESGNHWGKLSVSCMPYPYAVTVNPHNHPRRGSSSFDRVTEDPAGAHPLAQASIRGVCPLLVRWLMTPWRKCCTAAVVWPFTSPLSQALILAPNSVRALMTALMTSENPAAAARCMMLLLLPNMV